MIRAPPATAPTMAVTFCASEGAPTAGAPGPGYPEPGPGAEPPAPGP
jgi:hypothetical protein